MRKRRAARITRTDPLGGSAGPGAESDVCDYVVSAGDVAFLHHCSAVASGESAVLVQRSTRFPVLQMRQSSDAVVQSSGQHERMDNVPG